MAWARSFAAFLLCAFVLLDSTSAVPLSRKIRSPQSDDVRIERRVNETTGATDEDCEKDGRRYANGEKVEDPENPCQLCYCQGGSIQCLAINCFWRDDCEPRERPGRCCPSFDHCPPLDSISVATLTPARPGSELAEAESEAKENTSIPEPIPNLQASTETTVLPEVQTETLAPMVTLRPAPFKNLTAVQPTTQTLPEGQPVEPSFGGEMAVISNIIKEEGANLDSLQDQADLEAQYDDQMQEQVPPGGEIAESDDFYDAGAAEQDYMDEQMMNQNLPVQQPELYDDQDDIVDEELALEDEAAASDPRLALPPVPIHSAKKSHGVVDLAKLFPVGPPGMSQEEEADQDQIEDNEEEEARLIAAQRGQQWAAADNGQVDRDDISAQMGLLGDSNDLPSVMMTTKAPSTVSESATKSETMETATLSALGVTEKLEARSTTGSPETEPTTIKVGDETNTAKGLAATSTAQGTQTASTMNDPCLNNCFTSNTAEPTTQVPVTSSQGTADPSQQTPKAEIGVLNLVPGAEQMFNEEAAAFLENLAMMAVQDDENKTQETTPATTESSPATTEPADETTTLQEEEPGVEVKPEATDLPTTTLKLEEPKVADEPVEVAEKEVGTTSQPSSEEVATTEPSSTTPKKAEDTSSTEPAVQEAAASESPSASQEAEVEKEKAGGESEKPAADEVSGAEAQLDVVHSDAPTETPTSGDSSSDSTEATSSKAEDGTEAPEESPAQPTTEAQAAETTTVPEVDKEKALVQEQTAELAAVNPEKVVEQEPEEVVERESAADQPEEENAKETATTTENQAIPEEKVDSESETTTAAPTASSEGPEKSSDAQVLEETKEAEQPVTTEASEVTTQTLKKAERLLEDNQETPIEEESPTEAQLEITTEAPAEEVTEPEITADETTLAPDEEVTTQALEEVPTITEAVAKEEPQVEERKGIQEVEAKQEEQQSLPAIPESETEAATKEPQLETTEVAAEIQAPEKTNDEANQESSPVTEVSTEAQRVATEAPEETTNGAKLPEPEAKPAGEPEGLLEDDGHHDDVSENELDSNWRSLDDQHNTDQSSTGRVPVIEVQIVPEKYPELCGAEEGADSGDRRHLCRKLGEQIVASADSEPSNVEETEVNTKTQTTENVQEVVETILEPEVVEEAAELSKIEQKEDEPKTTTEESKQTTQSIVEAEDQPEPENLKGELAVEIFQSEPAPTTQGPAAEEEAPEEPLDGISLVGSETTTVGQLPADHKEDQTETKEVLELQEVAIIEVTTTEEPQTSETTLAAPASTSAPAINKARRIDGLGSVLPVPQTITDNQKDVSQELTVEAGLEVTNASRPDVEEEEESSKELAAEPFKSFFALVLGSTTPSDSPGESSERVTQPSVEEGDDEMREKTSAVNNATIILQSVFLRKLFV